MRKGVVDIVDEFLWCSDDLEVGELFDLLVQRRRGISVERKANAQENIESQDLKDLGSIRLSCDFDVWIQGR